MSGLISGKPYFFLLHTLKSVDGIFSTPNWRSSINPVIGAVTKDME